MHSPHSESEPRIRRARFRQGAIETLTAFGWRSRQARTAAIGGDSACPGSDRSNPLAVVSIDRIRSGRQVRVLPTGNPAGFGTANGALRLFSMLAAAKTVQSIAWLTPEATDASRFPLLIEKGCMHRIRNRRRTRARSANRMSCVPVTALKPIAPAWPRPEFGIGRATCAWRHAPARHRSNPQEARRPLGASQAASTACRFVFQL